MQTKNGAKHIPPLLLALSAAVLVLSSPAAAVEVGSTVPDLTLASLGGGDRTLSARDAPTVLVFFRGVW